VPSPSAKADSGGPTSPQPPSPSAKAD